jgi:hypothetical protein
MRTFAFIHRLLFCLCIAAAPAAFAQMTTNFDFSNVNLASPQDDLNGAQNSQTITGVPGEITDLQVSLLLAGTGDGAFDGNLYMELVNGAGGFAVLFNRVGMSSSNPFGYADNGFDITLSDSAVNDVHFYQNFSYNLNANGQVTGTWQPDGENISPLSDPSAFDNALHDQTAMLSSFSGDSPDDTWTLYAADVSQGDSEQVVSWSLNITTSPEPKDTSLIVVGLILWIWLRRRQKSTLQQKR